MIVQKLKKSFSQIELAIAYYSLIACLNKIHLTERELQLLAFTAVKGSITNPAVREEFCKTYSSSQATVNNMISKLKRMKLLVKDHKKKIKVTPAIALDFNSSIVLQISLLKNAS